MWDSTNTPEHDSLTKSGKVLPLGRCRRYEQVTDNRFQPRRDVPVGVPLDPFHGVARVTEV